jgi:hypothetical protein
VTNAGPLPGMQTHPTNGAPFASAFVAATQYLDPVPRARPMITTALAVVMALVGCAREAQQATAPPGEATQSTAAEAANVSASASAAPSPSRPGPLFDLDAVNLSVSGYWSWAFLDFATGEVKGSSPPATTSDTASMSKAWVAADYLRRAAERRQKPNATIMTQLSTMIRDSDTAHAFEFHIANGNITSIQRMTKLCGLTDTRGVQNSWSLTQMSARDVVRLGRCIADGRAAGPTWTGWLLNEMRNVRGPGRFGIIEALPADVAKATAIKNGWLAREDGKWHIACLAIGESWSIGVMARYPSSLGKDYGARICRDVTRQLLATQ